MSIQIIQAYAAVVLTMSQALARYVTMLKQHTASGLRWLWLSIILIAVDRYSKVWAVDHLTLFEPLKVLPFFNLTLAFNKGAAFSFLHSASGWQNWVLGGLAFVVSAIILVWLA